MKNEKCPTCFMSLKNDAMLERYCRFCGMGFDGDSKKFCCNDCLKKYRIVFSERRTRGEINEKNN